MAKFLLVWEIGANLGHMGLLLPVAVELHARGHQVTMVLQKSTDLEKFGVAHHFPCLTAPQLPHAPVQRPLLSYADVLMHLGYDRPEVLYETICAWRAIYEREKPDVVVFNAAPTATLAARGLPFKTVLYGTSFDLPPMTTPLPAFRSWATVPRRQLLDIESAILKSINLVMVQLKQAPLTHLLDLFQSDLRMLLAMVELDHYPQRKSEKYWGCRVSTDGGKPFQWKGHAKYRVFIYLRLGGEMLRSICAQMNDPDCEYVFVAPNIDTDECNRLSTGNLWVINQPLKIDDVVKDCSLVVYHAGVGTTISFLANGIPLLVLPSQIEQFLMARQVAQHGYGLMCNLADPQFDMAAPISQLLKNSKFRKSAQSFAQKYAARCNRDLMPSIVDRLCTLTR
jgi:UDP-N-acetylglucosamine transferase subunit ALG13